MMGLFDVYFFTHEDNKYVKSLINERHERIQGITLRRTSLQKNSKDGGKWMDIHPTFPKGEGRYEAKEQPS